MDKRKLIVIGLLVVLALVFFLNRQSAKTAIQSSGDRPVNYPTDQNADTSTAPRNAGDANKVDAANSNSLAMPPESQPNSQQETQPNTQPNAQPNAQLDSQHENHSVTHSETQSQPANPSAITKDSQPQKTKAPEMFIPTKRAASNGGSSNDAFSIPTKGQQFKSNGPVGSGAGVKIRKSKDELENAKPKSYSGNPEDLLLDGENKLSQPKDD